MPWARASALDRHLECPAASHLPQLDRGVWRPGYLIPAGHSFVPPVTPIEEKDSSAADWGTAMHAAKAGAPDAQDPWLVWMAPRRDKLWPNHLGEHEVAVSYNCRTRSVQLFRAPTEEARTDWKMAQDQDCVVGTADWWGALPTGEPWIDDLKTGWAPPDVVSNPMLFYMMCRMKQEDAIPWDRGRMSITWWPRRAAKEDEDGNLDIGEPSRDGLWKQVTRMVLDTFEEELHRAWVRAVGLNPAPRPGGHCLWCPSASVCDRANE